MLTTNLRQVDGSVVVAVPAAILELLELEVGSAVELTVEGQRLVMHAAHRKAPRYTLTDLLHAADYAQPTPPEERVWIDEAAQGRELI